MKCIKKFLCKLKTLKIIEHKLKGIFITTSSYSKGASEYANNLNGATTLVLINGLELANYIYEYNLGMQVEQVIEIKKLDSDYWDSLKDNVV